MVPYLMSVLWPQQLRMAWQAGDVWGWGSCSKAWQPHCSNPGLLGVLAKSSVSGTAGLSPTVGLPALMRCQCGSWYFKHRYKQFCDICKERTELGIKIPPRPNKVMVSAGDVSVVRTCFGTKPHPFCCCRAWPRPLYTCTKGSYSERSALSGASDSLPFIHSEYTAFFYSWFRMKIKHFISCMLSNFVQLRV